MSHIAPWRSEKIPTYQKLLLRAASQHKLQKIYYWNLSKKEVNQQSFLLQDTFHICQSKFKNPPMVYIPNSLAIDMAIIPMPLPPKTIKFLIPKNQVLH